MPIAVLPTKTQDLLSSTSIITSPVTLVKELVDNSIDAAADTIEVLISLNTVDKIEVRDNGIGIHADDYDFLGRPGHTSKLKNFDDLRTLAGTTLGFRGQALASANTVGKLTITTKTPSDPVAVILQIDPMNGGVLKQHLGSAPTGTTVSVTNLYREVPVRELHIVKDAKKTIDRIKDLLRSYAMAKPTIRLIFKVLSTPALNWNYSPKSNSGFGEAILQILGKEVASRCLESTASFSGRVRTQQNAQNAEAEIDSSAPSFIFSATIWKPNAEFLRLPRQRYFSVDARPVTSTRGTMQKLVAVYTKYLAAVLRTDVKALHDAFVRVSLRCPKGAYDINIEPSKDEVLFEDEQAIIDYFEAFCEDVYGPLASSEMQATSLPPTHDLDSSTSGRTPSVVDEQPTGPAYDAPKASNKTSSEPIDGEFVIAQNENQPAAEDLGEQQSSFNEIRRPQPTPPSPILTGWSLINSTAFPQQRDHSKAVPLNSNQLISDGAVSTLEIDCDMSADLSERVADPKWKKRLGISPHSTTMQVVDTSSRVPLRPLYTAEMNAKTGHVLPSQPEMRVFSMTPEPEVLRHRGAPPRDLDVPLSMSYPYVQSTESSLLNAMSSGPYQTPSSCPIGESRQSPSMSHRRQVRPPWTPPSTFQKDQDHRQNHTGLNKKTPNNGLKQTTITFEKSQHQRENQHMQNHNGALLQTSSQANTENEYPPYSPRNRMSVVGNRVANDAFHFQQEDVQQVVLPKYNTESQHHTHKEHAFTQLLSTEALAGSNSMAQKKAIDTSLPDEDPRAYLLKRQKSVTIDEIMGRPKKFRRTKSALLPLENVFTNDQTHEMISVLRVSIQNLRESLECYQIYDMYILEGGCEEALDINRGEARRVEERLDALLSEWSKSLGERIAVKSNLCLVLEGKGVNVGN